MNTEHNLKQELPLRFQEELAGRLEPGEVLLVTLSGSIGEALVVSNRRVFVIRERTIGANPAIDLHPYWLTHVAGATAAVQGTSGFIEINIKESKTDPDSARVYFPAYDIDKFRAAAELVQSMASRSAATRGQEMSADHNGLARGDDCPKCGAARADDAAFCVQCGEQLSPICAHCGRAAGLGANYCPSCGNKMVEQPTTCPTCGGRVTRWQMYCAACGSVLAVTCAGCGGLVLPNDKHCRSCGRLLGSDRVDGRVLGAFRARVTTAQQEAAPSVSEPERDLLRAETELDGEAHNRRGRELFEQDDILGAIREFQEAVRLDPNNASYHCNLAVAYDENDQDDFALQEYEKTLELDPNDLTALLSLGYLYNENEEPDKARQVWNRILEVAPLSAEAQEVRENLRHQNNL